MPHSTSRSYLYLLVFTAGFTTLGVELSASRLLDPWFGNSMIVWASLIGLILLFLALGYWLGGRIADRFPSMLALLRMAGIGALGVGLVPILSRPVLQLAGLGLADFNAGLLAGSMAAVLILFSVPITLLGCISPFAVRLSISSVQGSGRVAGRLFALSTAGSILGTFLPVLVLIPSIGTRRTFALLSGVLLLVTMMGSWRLRRKLESTLLLGAIALVTWLAIGQAGPIKPASGLLYETESRFNYIQVIDTGVERQLRLNEGEGIHSVYRPQGGLADGIWDYFLMAPAFNPAPYTPARVRRVAIVGLAAGTMAHLFTAAYGPIVIDGAELDPEIIATGLDWFELGLPNLHAYAMDGRKFLAWQQKPPPAAPGAPPIAYDLIAVDAYRPPYIPFHLTTVEFFTLARSRLAQDGVVAVNVGRTHSDYSLVNAIAATMAVVFPSVYVVDEPDNGSPLGNSLVVATRRYSTQADLRANLESFDHPLLAEVARRASPQVRPAKPAPDAPIFTDDRAPVEQVVHALILRHLAENAWR